MRRIDREIKNPEEILAIIEKADTCRLAFADNNTPYIVALNFGYTRNENQQNGLAVLYFHCANAGRKIDLIRKNNFVCFQMDIDHELMIEGIGCNCGMNYRSVTGMGAIEIITDENEKLLGMNSIMKHYSRRESFVYDSKIFKSTMILKLNISEISGKGDIEKEK